MGNEISSWDLIELKKFNEACIRADEEYKSTGSVFHLRNKAIALLNLMKYDEVFDIASEIIKITNGKNDSDYITAGIAYWLMGKQKEAGNKWVGKVLRKNLICSQFCRLFKKQHALQ